MARHRKPQSMSCAPIRTVGIALAVAGLLAGQAAGQLVQDAITPTHDVRAVHVVEHQPGGPLATYEPTENDAGWDCRTMGNRLCG
jgi:hypothetical protein